MTSESNTSSQGNPLNIQTDVNDIVPKQDVTLVETRTVVAQEELQTRLRILEATEIANLEMKEKTHENSLKQKDFERQIKRLNSILISVGLFAALVLIFGFCLLILKDAIFTPSEEEKKWATSILGLIVSSTISYFVGRASTSKEDKSHE